MNYLNTTVNISDLMMANWRALDPERYDNMLRAFQGRDPERRTEQAMRDFLVWKRLVESLGVDAMAGCKIRLRVSYDSFSDDQERDRDTILKLDEDWYLEIVHSIPIDHSYYGKLRIEDELGIAFTASAGEMINRKVGEIGHMGSRWPGEPNWHRVCAFVKQNPRTKCAAVAFVHSYFLKRYILNLGCGSLVPNCTGEGKQIVFPDALSALLAFEELGIEGDATILPDQHDRIISRMRLVGAA